MPLNLFDANFYRSANSDLRNYSDVDARRHFQDYGLDEGRSFSPFVDLGFYRASNPELGLSTNQQAFENLSNYDIAEGRKFSPIFDLSFYRQNNTDLSNYSNEQLFEHLRSNGVTEGRKVSSVFDVNYYLAVNPDVNQAVKGDKLAGLNHFMIIGLDEGRRFSVAFDVNYYRNASPDIAYYTNKQLLEHLSNYGLDEGRVTADGFDVRYYLAENSDLSQKNFSYKQGYEDFVSSGLDLGRNASEYIQSDFAGNSFDSARQISLNSQPVILRDAIGDTDTSDIYKFDVSPQNVNLSVKLNGLSADAQIDLWDMQGNQLASSINQGTSMEAIDYQNLAVGSYFVHIYQGNVGANTNYNLTLAVTSTSDTVPKTISPISTTSDFQPKFTQTVVELINYERIQAGLKPLSLNAKLNQSASTHSQDMAEKDYFNHTGSDGSRVSDRIYNAGYHYSLASENIAAGQYSPEEVVQAWMDSPTHRANIMSADYQEIGVGYYYLENDTGNVNYNHYWTTDFGTIF
ncbi:CAP domain-containing protein [Calothrix sp. PCC 6303]|uniref:CAP domain-containing protein n=1 Tax=Calothrix sp. PCC 6303 TaxID=1170562 RepID=UPI0002A02491|nr:CAP domain-containing protein [Calothrix sp. PCC 6303]AFZ03544.1 SCP-like extracellular [Calothrix sp. PCC 6303]